MRQVLFEWRGMKVYAYTAMLYLGLVSGVMGGTYAGTLHGLAPGPVYALMLLLILPALLGARLLFVASNWSFYRRDPSRIWPPSNPDSAQFRAERRRNCAAS